MVQCISSKTKLLGYSCFFNRLLFLTVNAFLRGSHDYLLSHSTAIVTQCPAAYIQTNREAFSRFLK
uniref:Uncharacterized protein n=1 Tax=Anguilla anguilla TaxID=7936 RepID=A0A0E9QTR7_ANGAN